MNSSSSRSNRSASQDPTNHRHVQALDKRFGVLGLPLIKFQVLHLLQMLSLNLSNLILLQRKGVLTFFQLTQQQLDLFDLFSGLGKLRL